MSREQWRVWVSSDIDYIPARAVFRSLRTTIRRGTQSRAEGNRVSFKSVWQCRGSGQAA